MASEQDGRRRVKSLSSLLTIVHTLKERDGAGVTELADEVGMAKSTVHRYLSTMEEHDYVVKENGTYYLGLRVLSLGEYVRNRKTYYRMAKPKTQQLAEETGERVQFIVEEHGRGIYVHRVHGEHAVRTDARIGKRTFLHTSAAGKSILSKMDESAVMEIIDRWGLPKQTENTIDDVDELMAELEETRERGYAINKAEHVEGLWGVGAPVVGPDDEVLGALSIGGPMRRMRKKIENRDIPSTLLGETNELELNIEYT
jgi:DNA-binding IclR family transcriptional regulator